MEDELVTCGCCGRKVEIYTTVKIGVSEDCWEYLCKECREQEDGNDLS